jgi:hypothetical protein
MACGAGDGADAGDAVSVLSSGSLSRGERLTGFGVDFHGVITRATIESTHACEVV